MIEKKLDQSYVDSKLMCPEGKSRVEIVCPMRTGLYIEVRASSPGQGTFYLRYKDAAGKTCHQKIGRTADITLGEARKRAKDLKAEIQLGADPRGEHKAKKAVPTLSEFWRDSVEPYIKPRKRSYKDDLRLFNNRISKTFGDKRLSEIKRQEVLAFQASLLAENLAPATTDRHIALLRHILNLSVEWEVIPVNPISRIKLMNPDNRVSVYLDKTQLTSLLSVLKSDSNRVVCNIALYLLSTGARLNEALSATWDQIDRQNCVWRIPASNTKAKRIRAVPLNDSALEVIDALGTHGKSPYLFVSPKTKDRIRYCHKAWEKIRLQTLTPKLRIHDLRHQMAGMMIAQNRTLFEVQQVLGHSNNKVTERYICMTTKNLIEAANSASVLIQAAMPSGGMAGPSTRALPVGAPEPAASGGDLANAA